MAERPTRRARHAIPSDVAARLEKSGLRKAYDARPPYQRNDYIGWILQAKRPETRERRIAQMLAELKRGDAYMNMAWKPKT